MSKFSQYILEETHISTIDDIKGVPEEAAKIMKSIVDYMIELKMNVEPLPKVKVIDDEVEAKKILGDTGNYDGVNKIVTIFVKNRHPEDYIRSFCHELIHHIQNMEGRLNHGDTQNINKDEELERLESEANRRGMMIFRAFKDELLDRK